MQPQTRNRHVGCLAVYLVVKATSGGHAGLFCSQTTTCSCRLGQGMNESLMSDGLAWHFMSEVTRVLSSLKIIVSLRG